jgi:ABC-type transport system involved in multi-copper enzyme maturation permease subunit
MIWLTWRQFRTPAVVALAALAVIAVALGISNPHPPAADANGFLSHYHLLQFFSTALVGIPGLLGAFWGAPLMARELETGTWRLVWTQSITRTRWLATKVAFVGLASMAAAGLVSLMLTGWSSRTVNLGRFSSAMFAERGIAPIGYAGFGFAVGLVAGLLIRRTLPAMATTLATFLAVRLAVTYVVRPHFARPLTLSKTLTSLGSGPSFPTKPGDWIISDNTIDAAGHITNNIIRCGVQVPAGSPAPGDAISHTAPSAVHACLAGYRQVLTYQPAGRYWMFQSYETAIFLGLALLLVGFCFWWIRKRFI